MFRIATASLRKVVNPLDGIMWDCAPISKDDVLDAIRDKHFDGRQWNDIVRSSSGDMRDYHIARIATLCVEGLTLEKCVLIAEIKIGTSPDKFYMNDGNHRLAATYINSTQTVDLAVATNDEDQLVKLYPFFTPI